MSTPRNLVPAEQEPLNVAISRAQYAAVIVPRRHSLTTWPATPAGLIDWGVPGAD